MRAYYIKATLYNRVKNEVSKKKKKQKLPHENVAQLHFKAQEQDVRLTSVETVVYIKL